MFDRFLQKSIRVIGIMSKCEDVMGSVDLDGCTVGKLDVLCLIWDEC